MDAWEKFKNSIKKNELVMAQDKIILAVSGGPDSVCLTHLFWRHAKTVDLELLIVYFDHGLRKQAKKEVLFIEKLGKKFGIQVFVQKLPVKEYSNANKISIETAGRDLRYLELDKIAKRFRFNKIATGHNANDNAETMLMWLVRGTGAEGLSGIPLYRPSGQNIRIIRPLLSITRPEISKYLKNQSLHFCIDHSNFDLGYTRNKIRHRLIPILNRYNNCIIEHLYNLSRIISSENAYLNEMAKRAEKRTVTKSADKISLDLKRFFGYNKTIQKRIIKSVLPQKRSLVQIERLMEFLSIPGQKNINFSSNWKIKKTSGKLTLIKFNS